MVLPIQPSETLNQGNRALAGPGCAAACRPNVKDMKNPSWVSLLRRSGAKKLISRTFPDFHGHFRTLWRFPDSTSTPRTWVIEGEHLNSLQRCHEAWQGVSVIKTRLALDTRPGLAVPAKACLMGRYPGPMGSWPARKRHMGSYNSLRMGCSFRKGRGGRRWTCPRYARWRQRHQLLFCSHCSSRILPGDMGRLRSRSPVASWMPLAMAAMGGTMGTSPTPLTP